MTRLLEVNATVQEMAEKITTYHFHLHADLGWCALEVLVADFVAFKKSQADCFPLFPAFMQS